MLSPKVNIDYSIIKGRMGHIDFCATELVHDVRGPGYIPYDTTEVVGKGWYDICNVICAERFIQKTRYTNTTGMPTSGIVEMDLKSVSCWRLITIFKVVDDIIIRIKPLPDKFISPPIKNHHKIPDLIK